MALPVTQTRTRTLIVMASRALPAHTHSSQNLHPCLPSPGQGSVSAWNVSALSHSPPALLPALLPGRVLKQNLPLSGSPPGLGLLGSSTSLCTFDLAISATESVKSCGCVGLLGV